MIPGVHARGLPYLLVLVKGVEPIWTPACKLMPLRITRQGDAMTKEANP